MVSASAKLMEASSASATPRIMAPAKTTVDRLPPGPSASRSTRRRVAVEEDEQRRRDRLQDPSDDHAALVLPVEVDDLPRASPQRRRAARPPMTKIADHRQYDEDDPGEGGQAALAHALSRLDAAASGEYRPAAGRRKCASSLAAPVPGPQQARGAQRDAGDAAGGQSDLADLAALHAERRGATCSRS